MIIKLLFVLTLRFCDTLAWNSSYSGLFTYRGNTSYSDESLMISEIAPGGAGVDLGYCAIECFSNLDCNAVEICSAVAGNTCRLSHKPSTSMTSGNDSCSRYELVRIVKKNCICKCFSYITLSQA
jgi:hypothetical protein